jgi:hypothetical protein
VSVKTTAEDDGSYFGCDAFFVPDDGGVAAPVRKAGSTIRFCGGSPFEEFVAAQGRGFLRFLREKRARRERRMARCVQEKCTRVCTA